MNKTIINVKTDKKVKERAQRLAAELGLSLSDVIGASLRNFLRTREVLFSAAPHMTAELERFLGHVENDIKTKKNLSPAFSSANELEEYLDTL